MIRIIAIALLGYALAAHADPLKFANVKAQNGAPLSLDELNALLSGAAMVSISTSGNTRRWTNDTDGKLTATCVGCNFRAGGRSVTAPGTWRVDPNGTYCVSIDWPSQVENWCRRLYKVGDKYYAVKPTADDDTPAHELTISK